MSYPITNEDVAGILDVLGQPGNAATVRHFAQPTPPVAWADEIDALNDEVDRLRDELETVKELLCKRCKAKWDEANTV